MSLDTKMQKKNQVKYQILILNNKNALLLINSE